MWLDAKKWWVRPEKLRVWGSKAGGRIIADHPSLFMSGKTVCLHYYAVVNAELGPVAIMWVTGTTGMRKRYKVRTCCASAVVAQAYCCRCRLLLPPLPLPTSSKYSASTVVLAGRW